MARNPWLPYVNAFSATVRRGRKIPLPKLQPPPKLRPDAPRVLIFSPHPDDEVIIGSLPLRLMKQRGYRVVNVAVTLGSKASRRDARLEELRHACAFAGFDLEVPNPRIMQRIHTSERDQQPIRWSEKVDLISELLLRLKPVAILYPHKDDWNRTHVGTHWLIRDVLATVGDKIELDLFETEFWGQMHEPNLLVEVPSTILATQLGALALHRGEVERNPYHLILPAWMMDNVRRGAELVGGQGGESPGFLFGVLYRWRLWKKGQIEETYPGHPFVPAGVKPPVTQG